MVSFRAIVAVAVTLDGGVGCMSFPGIMTRRPEEGVVSDDAVCGTSFPEIERRRPEDGSLPADDLH